MCGAGTIALEAATWSRNVAPGLGQARFGFERWASHDDVERRAMAGLREQAHDAVKKDGPPVFAYDVDPRVLELAEANARAAGVELVLERRDVRNLEPLHPPGFVVTNPPYGERLDADFALYDGMARAFRSMRGHTVALLAGAAAIGEAMKRRPDKSWQLYNGPIECRLLVYAMR
jgi:putative N6-adenine-specific DNA methylase